MKILFLAIYLMSVQMVFAQVSNPVQNYYALILQNQANDRAIGVTDSDANGPVYKWTADLFENGSPVIFLAMKDFYKSARHDSMLPAWSVYLPNEEGTGYMNTTNNEPQIDPDKMYIGQITQLDQRGIVTIQIDRPRRDPPVARIYAYTTEGNHLKQTKLDEYNPDEGSNAVYNQYLSDSHRSRVQLQEIAP